MIFQHCSSQEGKLLDMLGEKEVDLIIGLLVNKKKNGSQLSRGKIRVSGSSPVQILFETYDSRFLKCFSSFLADFCFCWHWEISFLAVWQLRTLEMTDISTHLK